MTEYDKEYLLHMVNKEFKQSKINYERGMEVKGTTLEHMINLHKKANAKETVQKIIKFVLDHNLEDSIINEVDVCNIIDKCEGSKNKEDDNS